MSAYKTLLRALIYDLEEIIDYYNRSTYDMASGVVDDFKVILEKYKKELGDQ